MVGEAPPRASAERTASWRIFIAELQERGFTARQCGLLTAEGLIDYVLTPDGERWLLTIPIDEARRVAHVLCTLLPPPAQQTARTTR